jgi:hypothetical protein
MRLFRRVTINQAWQKALTGDNEESLLTSISDVVMTLPLWTPEQLTQAINDLESLPDWQDRQTTFKMIQFVLLDLMLAANDLPELGNRLDAELPEDVQKVLQTIQFIGIDWNIVAKELNNEVKAYGELLERAANSSLEEQFDLLYLRPMKDPLWTREKWEAFVTGYVQKIDNPLSLNPLVSSGRSKWAGMAAGYLFTQIAGEVYRLQLMEESRCQALRLALALERFHRETEHYPESLGELGLRPMVPDIHIQYERQGDGYRLYNKVFQLEQK